MTTSRLKTIGGAFIAIGVLLGTSLFFFPQLWYPDYSNDIVEEAENNVPEPTFPPPPGADTVTEEVPTTTYVKKRIFGRSIRIPVVTTHQVERLVNPTTEQMTEWQERSASMSDAYRAKLQEEINRITAERRSESREALKDYVLVLSTLLSIVFGAVNIVLAIRKDRREQRTVGP